MLTGGRLATPPTRNLTVGAYWYVADAPRSAIKLRATQLDRDATPIEFTAVGFPANMIMSKPGQANPWDQRWYYRTSVDFVDVFPTAAGCWKVQLVDGRDDDVVVLELWGIGPPR